MKDAKGRKLQFYYGFHYIHKLVLILTQSWNARWTWHILELPYIHWSVCVERGFERHCPRYCHTNVTPVYMFFYSISTSILGQRRCVSIDTGSALSINRWSCISGGFVAFLFRHNWIAQKRPIVTFQSRRERDANHVSRRVSGSHHWWLQRSHFG